VFTGRIVNNAYVCTYVFVVNATNIGAVKCV